MSLSFNVKQSQRIDLWLIETTPASEALFTIRRESAVVFKIKMAPCYYSCLYLDHIAKWQGLPGLVVRA